MFSLLVLSLIANLKANALLVTETNYVTQVANVYVNNQGVPTATVVSDIDIFQSAAPAETAEAQVETQAQAETETQAQAEVSTVQPADVNAGVNAVTVVTSEDTPVYTESAITTAADNQDVVKAPNNEPTSVETQQPAQTQAAPADTSSSSSEEFSGEATYYDVGLGACGVTNSNSELIAAMNVNQFGTQSNGNPICGKKATLSYQGKSVTVTVQDKCPGCGYGDIDLSPAAFQALADESLGRIPITWHFD